MGLNGAFWCNMKQWFGILICWYILKTRTLTGAFWRCSNLWVYEWHFSCYGLEESSMKIANISCTVTLHPLSLRFVIQISSFQFLGFWKWWYARVYVHMPSYGPDHGGQFCSVICFREHGSEITHIVKTDNLSKTQLIVWNKCSFSCHLKETNVKTKKQFYESTNEKLKL